MVDQFWRATVGDDEAKLEDGEHGGHCRRLRELLVEAWEA
jgi:hypothetical protein